MCTHLELLLGGTFTLASFGMVRFVGVSLQAYYFCTSFVEGPSYMKRVTNGDLATSKALIGSTGFLSENPKTRTLPGLFGKLENIFVVDSEVQFFCLFLVTDDNTQLELYKYLKSL